jgi:hypothetical protein
MCYPNVDPSGWTLRAFGYSLSYFGPKYRPKNEGRRFAIGLKTRTVRF